MKLNRETFADSDLTKLPEPVNPVLLKSGGPIMEAETEQEDSVLCAWKERNGRMRRIFQTA
jgi:uncharacterized protein YodC (DUF2158 family)